jgi:hypothetical protein
MRRVQRNGLAQVVQRLFQRLIRQAVHQIEVKAAKAKSCRQEPRVLPLPGREYVPDVLILAR